MILITKMVNLIYVETKMKKMFRRINIINNLKAFNKSLNKINQLVK